VGGLIDFSGARGDTVKKEKERGCFGLQESKGGKVGGGHYWGKMSKSDWGGKNFGGNIGSKKL